jgi:hypothetical protein
MGELVDGDDGLPAEEVGKWAKTKHESLCRYIDISRGVRRKWIAPRKAGATYIDLFCGQVDHESGEPANLLTEAALQLGERASNPALRSRKSSSQMLILREGHMRASE